MLWGKTAAVTGRNPPHAHDMHELVVCLSDTGSHWVNGVDYAFTTGRTIFLPSGHPHFVAGTAEAAALMFVCFDQAFLAQTGDDNFLCAVLQSGKERRYASVDNAGHQAVARELAGRILDELAVCRPWSEVMAASLVRQLLVAHCRAVPAASRAQALAASEKIAQIARWIADHPEKPHVIDQLAARACMSRSVFTRSFRKHTGMSLVEFLNDARVRRAMVVLGSRPEESVSEIAQQCGFNNLGHFHAVFRSICGTSPRRYRHAVVADGPFPPIIREYPRGEGHPGIAAGDPRSVPCRPPRRQARA